MLNEQAIKWFNPLRSLSLREQIAIIILGMAVIYFLWYLILMRPLSITQQELKARINTIKANLNAIQDELSHISAGKKVHTTQSDEIKQNLAKMLASLKDPSLAYKLINQIVTYRLNDVEFVSLKSDPPASWEFEGQSMTKYSHQLDFKGNYFGAIHYLQFIERLPAYIYWDSMSYSVANYPQGNVTVKFYTIGN